MSICTKTGDDGTTGLMYNRRVSKSDRRIEATGTLDELNAAIGMSRALARESPFNPRLRGIQEQLVIVMGELATLKEDEPRYLKDGFVRVSPLMYEPLEQQISDLEELKVSYKGWATPGANPEAAALDMARTICRRAERRVQELLDTIEIQNRDILIYLNRLSDLLWLMARKVEASAR